MSCVGWSGLCIRGLLLKHAATYKIKIFAYMFLPHRFGLLLQALENNLHRFMCRFQRDLSRALQKYHGIDERIFTTRYIDNPVMEDARACSAHTRLRCHRARRLRGRCMTACGEAKRKFREQRKQNDERYTSAANRRRRGLNAAYFPAGMIPPGHRFAVGSPGAIWAGENPQDPAEIQAREAAAGHG